MTAAVAIDRGAVPCGVHVRYAHREGKGPRGGRRTWTAATCVACGRVAEVQDRHAGSRDTPRARARLRDGAPCPRPRVPSDAERLLVALVPFVRAGVSPTLAFAIEWVPDGDLDAAVQRAWGACPNGFAMGRVLQARAAAAAAPDLHRYLAWESPCGTDAYVAFVVRGLGVELRGPRALVADAIRLHVAGIRWRDGMDVVLVGHARTP